MRFRAQHLVDSRKWPTTAGEDFAKTLLDTRLNWNDLSIQLTGVPASVLIDPFWQGFKQEIMANAPGMWELVLNVEWICDHKFQEDNIKKSLARPI